MLALEAHEALLLAADAILRCRGIDARDQVLAVELVVAAIGIVLARSLAGRQFAAAVAQHRHHALVVIEHDQPARLFSVRRVHRLPRVVAS